MRCAPCSHVYPSARPQCRLADDFCQLAAAGPKPESPQNQQGLLAERAAAGQDPELNGGVVEVEERAHPEQTAVLELAIEHAVDDHEAVRPYELSKSRVCKGFDVCCRHWRKDASSRAEARR